MPTCENCQHEWTWKDSMKSMATLGHGWECKQCSEKQFPTKETRKRHMIATMIIPVFILLQSFTDFSAVIIMAAMFSAALIVLLTMPFYTEVQNEEEPLW